MSNPAQDATGQPVFTFKVLSSNSLPKGTEIAIGGERVAIGSDAERCAIVLVGDIKVSATHAAVQQEGEDFVLYDTDSVSGTFVNGAELHRGHKLVPGDKVQIGDTVLTFAKRRIWTQEARSLREMMPDLVAVLAVLLVAGGALWAMGEPPEPRLLTEGAAAPTGLPEDEKDVAKWEVNSFAKLQVARAKEEDAARARQHFERGLRCFREITLDSSNAFSGILELRRAKAYMFGNTDVQAQLPTQMDLGRADELITKCQRYLRFQKRKYEDAYFHALGIADLDKAAACCRRVMSMFSGKFNGEKSQEYVDADQALTKLGRRVLERPKAAGGMF